MERLKGRAPGFMTSLNEVEMGKKDDDFPKHKPFASVDSQPWRRLSRVSPTRRNIKRGLFLSLLTLAAYAFVVNIANGEWGNLGQSRDGAEESTIGHRASPQPQDALEDGNEAVSSDDNVNDEKITLPNLHLTLRALSGIGSAKNILFAASNPQSVANILPLACDMGKARNADISFAFMGNTHINLRDMQKLNGIDNKCRITLHDARVNHPTQSTEARLQRGVIKAMDSLNVYLRPDAIFVDGSGREERYFVEGMDAALDDTDAPVIKLPFTPTRSLGWLSKLDSQALNAWHKTTIDIVVHTATATAGSIIRLLTSLSEADYEGGQVPRLTVELGADVDPITEKFISTFQWPPSKYRTLNTRNQLYIRKRTAARGILDEAHADVRFIESFYPSHPAYEHVLVLTPQIELQPNYFQYLRYAVLEYRHSVSAKRQVADQKLFGLALDVPVTGLDGTSPFNAPKTSKLRFGSKETFFLWQAPMSHALLIFGDRWAELHGFVVESLRRGARKGANKEGLIHQASAAAADKIVAAKQITTTMPAWTEHALRLSKLRGYRLLYPSPSIAGTLATVHVENAAPPEEYAEQAARAAEKRKQREKLVKQSQESHNNAYGVDPARDFRSLDPLVVTLPGAEKLPPLSELPLLAADGKLIDEKDLEAVAVKYRRDWRVEVGGCRPEDVVAEQPDDPRTGTQRSWVDSRAGDLFCSIPVAGSTGDSARKAAAQKGTT